MEDLAKSNGSVEGDNFVYAWKQVCRDMAAEQRAWLADLRSQGIYTAGFDDGWVDRKENSWMPPSYAPMLGPLYVGSKIALGDPKCYRVARVTRIGETMMFGSRRYYFEPVEMN